MQASPMGDGGNLVNTRPPSHTYRNKYLQHYGDRAEAIRQARAVGVTLDPDGGSCATVCGQRAARADAREGIMRKLALLLILLAGCGTAPAHVAVPTTTHPVATTIQTAPGTTTAFTEQCSTVMRLVNWYVEAAARGCLEGGYNVPVVLDCRNGIHLIALGNAWWGYSNGRPIHADSASDPAFAKANQDCNG